MRGGFAILVPDGVQDIRFAIAATSCAAGCYFPLHLTLRVRPDFR
jgi:hypothetical protein